MCEVPISIVAVNRIDHTNWLHNEFDIYGGDLNHLSPHTLFVLALSNSFDLPMCKNEWVVIPTLQNHKNVQFEDLSIFKEASDKDKFSRFQHGKIDGK